MKSSAHHNAQTAFASQISRIQPLHPAAAPTWPLPQGIASGSEDEVKERKGAEPRHTTAPLKVLQDHAALLL